MRNIRFVVRSIGFILITILIASCGGGGGGSVPGDSTSTTSLRGTAAAGAPIIGTVTVKGSLGNTKSALIEADGAYNVDVTGLTAPYRLRAVGTVGGRTYKLHSYAEAADLGGNVNITPFTDLIVANAAGQIAEAYFDSATPADLDPAELAAQEDALQAKLQAVFTALGVSTAIDLLNSTFSADHSGLDAALDIIRIEVDPGLQVATITNLVENTTIEDSVTDPDDNTGTLPVTNPGTLVAAVDDIQAIAGKFVALTAAFAGGLPTQASIDDLFSTDFLEEGTSRGLWLTDITTDPSVIGLTFSSVSVSDLDSTNGTATVTFNVSINGLADPEPIVWLFARDGTLGWQARGDQRIAEAEFSFHCNDNDGNGIGTGACGVNTRAWDDDFSNNGTGNAPIASAKVSILNGTDMTVRDVIYLGTPGSTAPGDVQVYNEGTQQYEGDYRGFGAGAGEINPAIFVVGDIIQYELYTQALDLSTPTAPQIAAGAVAVATYTDTLLFAPSLAALYPDATSATLSAINNFALGNDLTIAWTLAAGTRNSEVLVEISDSMGNRIEVWVDTFGDAATNTTVASTALDAAVATGAGLNGDAATYNLLVRIYAEDEVTGQAHSRDYTATNLATPPPPAALACNFESGWDDLADGGLGRPITPKSFADFEESLATCASDGTPAQTFTAADVAGSAFNDAGEITTFNALTGSEAGTVANPGSGTFDDGVDTIVFTWYIEDAGTHSYVVLYSDDTVDPVNIPAGVWFRETTALTNVTGTPGVAGAVYSFHRYSEQSNYSDTDRATGSDGEIWNSVDTLQ